MSSMQDLDDCWQIATVLYYVPQACVVYRTRVHLM